MENLKLMLVYTSPTKKFNGETETLVKLQIDNSLALGWKDIILYTNFPYEYKGIVAQIVPDIFCDFDPTANKTLVIDYLYKNDLLAGSYWYHDFDVFQNEAFSGNEVKLEDDGLGVCSYIYKDEYNFGSFFFDERSKGIFSLLSKRIFDRARPRVDEKTLTKLVNFEGLKITKLNPRFNMTRRNMKLVYSRCKKPVIGLHFHPNEIDYKSVYPDKVHFLTANNRTGIKFASDRLVDLFKSYGY